MPCVVSREFISHVNGDSEEWPRIDGAEAPRKGCGHVRTYVYGVDLGSVGMPCVDERRARGNKVHGLSSVPVRASERKGEA